MSSFHPDLAKYRQGGAGGTVSRVPVEFHLAVSVEATEPGCEADATGFPDSLSASQRHAVTIAVNATAAMHHARPFLVGIQASFVLKPGIEAS